MARRTAADILAAIMREMDNHADGSDAYLALSDVLQQFNTGTASARDPLLAKAEQIAYPDQHGQRD